MNLEQIAHRLWHATGREDMLRVLDTRPQGLSAEEVVERQGLFGPNVLPRAKRISPLIVYLRQFKSPLIYLLLAAAVVSMIIGEMADAGFIFAVLQINAVIGTIQEWKAESSAEALNSMIRNWVVVRREGNRDRIDSTGLVPGDVVLLESGALIPADIRLLDAKDLRVDESLLTGESVPVGREADLVLPEQAATGDRRNMLHAGATVISGRAEGVVTRTGQHTEIGRIAQALAGADTTAPPLVVRLERFTRTIGSLVVLAVAVLGVAQYLKGVAFAEIFLVSVALAVSAIPEGLPVAITIALSIGSARMARRNVIVRSLPAAEAPGACTLIASDKTGTLTCNELTAKRVFLPKKGEIMVDGQGYVPEGGFRREGGPLEDGDREALERLAISGALCNEASFRLMKDGRYHHFGDTVDVAFLVMAGKLGHDQGVLLESHPEADSIPFEPARRFAASFNRSGDRVTTHVKGAAEVVIPMCAGSNAEAMLAEATRMAADGYRVIALACGDVEDLTVGGLAELDFLGLVGLIDPLRPEAAEAVAKCGRAGIDVRMITGDHPATALAIARELGIAEDPEDVVTGVELTQLASDPAEVDCLADTVKVFARVEPMQKLAIVHSLQKAGHFVAVTGDGVNDAPALRAAHIGAAMGKEGTDVARGAADLIITDDNFSSIVSGVEEGRIAYDNVRKVVYLLVSTGASEIVLFFLAFLAGLPLPLFAVQLLWLNLVTNGIQHVALSIEKGEDDVLERQPRPPRQPIFDRPMIEQTLLSGTFIGVVAFLFFQWALDSGMSETTARNALLLLMVSFENAHVFNCRSERKSVFRHSLLVNPFLLFVVPTAQTLHIMSAHIPGLNSVLRVEPLTLDTWLTVAPMALGLVVVMEIYKLFRYGWSRRS